MAKELSPVWLDQNVAAYALNAANLSFALPSLACMGSRLLSPVDGQPGKLSLAGDCFIKLVSNGTHRAFKNSAALTFEPVNCLDVGTALQAGKDYSVYIVLNDNDADLVVSLDATWPYGATPETSRRIGGFHTLCLDVGTINGHPLSGRLAGSILPNSVWDLKHRPATCSAAGMVYSPQLKFWVDIYLQSGSGINTKSAFGGTVTKSQSYDSHSEDLAAVGKRMLWDNEFTQAAWGTEPYKVVQGSADPITTGGKVNTTGRRIISNIGCEDMCGCYQQWVYSSTAGSGSSWVTAVPGGQGHQYGPPLAMLAGGHWDDASYAGPRYRNGYNSRAVVSAHHSSRGAARALVLP